MNIFLVGFGFEFQARFESAVAANNAAINVLSTDHWSADSVHPRTDLLLLAFPQRANRFGRLRELMGHTDLPVIVLADHPNRVDLVAALELGADDYLPLYCEPRELIAHIRALLRTRRPGSDIPSNVLGVDGVALDAGLREAYIDGDKIDLTPNEYRLLHILMESAGQTVSRDELRRCLTREEDGGIERSVDVHISRLKEKLGARRDDIKTLPFSGYQLGGHIPLSRFPVASRSRQRAS